MIEAVKLWNEPNNLSHWDFETDRGWKIFSKMILSSSQELKQNFPKLPIVLGGLSPIDSQFIQLLDSYSTLQWIDIIAIHGFPLDWNHWKLDDWPKKIEEIKNVCSLPIWGHRGGSI